MKRALISSLVLAAAVMSGPVFAQAASDASRANSGPLTRAEVKAELIAAQRSGEYEAIRVDAASYPQLLPYLKQGGQTSTGATELTQTNSFGTALRAQ